MPNATAFAVSTKMRIWIDLWLRWLGRLNLLIGVRMPGRCVRLYGSRRRQFYWLCIGDGRLGRENDGATIACLATPTNCATTNYATTTTSIGPCFWMMLTPTLFG